MGKTAASNHCMASLSLLYANTIFQLIRRGTAKVCALCVLPDRLMRLGSIQEDGSPNLLVS